MTPTPMLGGGPAESTAETTKAASYSQWADVRRRFVRNRLAVAGLAMLAIVVLVAIFAPLLAPADPEIQDLTNTQASPSSAHWFGTDQNGRDQLSKVLYGTRIALMVAGGAVFLSLLVGIVLGAVAGYLGRAYDAVIMRITDFFLAFPTLIGAILITTVLDRSLLVLTLALAVFGWATAARLMRASILSDA